MYLQTNAIYPPDNASSISCTVHQSNNKNTVEPPKSWPLYDDIPDAIYPPNNAHNTPYVLYSINDTGYIPSRSGEPEEAPPSYESVIIGNRNTITWEMYIWTVPIGQVTYKNEYMDLQDILGTGHF